MTRAFDLWQLHRHDEAIRECKKGLAIDPDDLSLIDVMASALYAKGEYNKAIPLIERIGYYEQNRKASPGHPGRQLELSCAHWLLGDRQLGIHLMCRLVQDSLSGRIQYGDAAGGVTQGLLLYYMGTSEASPEVQSLALEYLEDRSTGSRIELWPGPVARYYLGKVDFESVLIAASGHPRLSEAIEIARNDLLRRRQLCVALFHDGTRRRAEGREEECRERMRECLTLENPLIELEWYLARGEIENEAARR
jgi:tetratricopeptide (TPR) repeat protein